MLKKMTRREFIKATGLLTGILTARSLFPWRWRAKKEEEGPHIRPFKKHRLKPGLAVVHGEDPAKITKEAVEILGGMERLVSKGDTVVIKPNIAWDRTPEQAANTNPQVVAALVKMCLKGGAKEVRVFDRPCHDPRRTYPSSGIEAAARGAGAKVYFVQERKFKEMTLKDAFCLDSWPIYEDILTADVVINVPIAKHHNMAKLTLGLKNLMGVCGGNRGRLHPDFNRKIVDINRMVTVDLTVIDAYRILLRHGPTGGRLEDVKFIKTVIAATDRVAADAYATRFFNMKPRDLKCLEYATQLGMGEMDLNKVKIYEKSS